MDKKKKKEYQKPQVKYRESLEAVAAQCGDWQAAPCVTPYGKASGVCALGAS